MNPYMASRERFGRRESYLDRQAFAAALAPMIGASVAETDMGEGSPEYRSVTLLLEGGDIRIAVRTASHREGEERVELTAYSPRASELVGGYASSTGPWPRATVHTGRPLDVVARDVKRRVVDPCAAPLQSLRDRLAREASEKVAVSDLITDLQSRFPTLSIGPNAAGDGIAIGGRGEVYLYGRMDSTGRLYIERAGSFDAATSVNVLAAMTGAAPASEQQKAKAAVTLKRAARAYHVADTEWRAAGCPEFGNSDAQARAIQDRAAARAALESAAVAFAQVPAAL